MKKLLPILAFIASAAVASSITPIQAKRFYLPPPVVATSSCNNQLASISTAGERHEADYFVGFRFTPSADITVCSLQRMSRTGNSQNHTVGIWSTSALVTSGTVDASTASDGNYATVSITPVVLTAGQVYVLACSEFAGGDLWNDEATATLTGATDAYSVYHTTTTPPSAGSDFSVLTPGKSFSAPNLKYQ